MYLDFLVSNANLHMQWWENLQFCVLKKIKIWTYLRKSRRTEIVGGVRLCSLFWYSQHIIQRSRIIMKSTSMKTSLFGDNSTNTKTKFKAKVVFGGYPVYLRTLYKKEAINKKILYQTPVYRHKMYTCIKSTQWYFHPFSEDLWQFLQVFWWPITVEL